MLLSHVSVCLRTDVQTNAAAAVFPCQDAGPQRSGLPAPCNLPTEDVTAWRTTGRTHDLAGQLPHGRTYKQRYKAPEPHLASGVLVVLIILRNHGFLYFQNFQNYGLPAKIIR